MFPVDRNILSGYRKGGKFFPYHWQTRDTQHLQNLPQSQVDIKTTKWQSEQKLNTGILSFSCTWFYSNATEMTETTICFFVIQLLVVKYCWYYCTLSWWGLTGTLSLTGAVSLSFSSLWPPSCSLPDSCMGVLEVKKIKIMVILTYLCAQHSKTDIFTEKNEYTFAFL